MIRLLRIITALLFLVTLSMFFLHQSTHPVERPRLPKKQYFFAPQRRPSMQHQTSGKYDTIIGWPETKTGVAINIPQLVDESAPKSAPKALSITTSSTRVVRGSTKERGLSQDDSRYETSNADGGQALLGVTTDEPSSSRLIGVHGDKDAAVDWSRFAYTQYVTNSEYLCNAVMIFETLHRLGSKPDRVMMYPSHMLRDSANDHNINQRQGDEDRLLRKARDEYNVKLVPIHRLNNDGTQSVYIAYAERKLRANLHGG